MEKVKMCSRAVCEEMGVNKDVLKNVFYTAKHMLTLQYSQLTVKTSFHHMTLLQYMKII